MRLGYIVPEFPGQTHIFFWRELQRLEEMGIEVDIVSTRRPPPGIRSHTWSDTAEKRSTYLQTGDVIADAKSIGGAIRSVPRGRWSRCFRSIARSNVSIVEQAQLLALTGFGAKLGQIASARQWRHMHVHSCGNAANIAAYASMLSDVPYSLTLHGPLSDYGTNQREKWSNASFGIAITKLLHSQLEDELGLSIAAKTIIAPMGVNVEKFQRTLPYRHWNGAEQLRLYSVGRLNPCKGHDVLIRAVSTLKSRGFDVSLTIAGQDESGGLGYHQDLKALIDELRLVNCVELAGAVSEDVVREGILASHIFVLASLQEPLGVAIMEAMALETPVVATNGGGVPELIDHETDGYLVPPGDPHQLAAAIELIAQDGALADRLAAASRQKIERSFQDTRSAEVLVQYAGLGTT